MDKLWFMTGCFLCIILSSDFINYVHLMTSPPITTPAQFETRILHCLPNEYGDNCTYCSPKDTCLDGHFTCDYSTGEKICLPGWSGKSCRTRTEPDMTFVSCPDNQCRNGGTCVSGQCCCVDGFTGILCEIEIIECTNTSCSNGGICKDLIGRYECLCRPNYSGEQCEITDISGSVQTTPHNDATCRHDTCLNNGTCFEDAIFTYCLCPTWFTGARCETSLKPQQSVANTACPVNHYGPSCTDVCVETDACTDGHYVCHEMTGEKVCKSGWIGDNCDTRMLPPQLDPYCPSGLGCKNDGQCNSGTCCCRQGYAGYLCEVQSIGCISSPCLHNGTCIETGDDAFMCLCGEGYSGPYCDVDLVTLTTPISVSTAVSAESTVSSSFLSFLPSPSTIEPSFTVDTRTIYPDTWYATPKTHAVTNTSPNISISPSVSFHWSKDISASESSMTESIQSQTKTETSTISEVTTNILDVTSSSPPSTDVDNLNSAYNGVMDSSSTSSVSRGANTIDLTDPSTITTYSHSLAELSTHNRIVPSPSFMTSLEVLKSVNEDSSSIFLSSDLPTMIEYSQSLSESPDVFYTSSSIHSETPSLQSVQSIFSSELMTSPYAIDMSMSSLDSDIYLSNSEFITEPGIDVKSTSAFNKIHQTDYYVTDKFVSVTNAPDSVYISNSDSHNIAMSSLTTDRINSKEGTSYFSNAETINPSTYYQQISHETSTYSVIDNNLVGTTSSLLLESSLKPNSALTLPQITSTGTKLGLQSSEITLSLSTSEIASSFIDTPGPEKSSNLDTSSSVETFSSLLEISTPSAQVNLSSILSSTNELNTQTNTAVPSFTIDHTYNSIASSASNSHLQTSYNPNIQTSTETISTYEMKPTSVKESANSLSNENVSTIINAGITTGLSPQSSKSVATDSVTPKPTSMSAGMSSGSAMISSTENSRQFLSATTRTKLVPLSTTPGSLLTSSLQESGYSTDINLASQTISSQTPVDLPTDDGDSLVWWIILIIVLAVVVIGVFLVILAIVVVWWIILIIVLAVVVIGVSLVILAIVVVRKRRSDFRAIEQNPEAILGYDKEHFSFQPDIANPTFEPDDSDDDSVKHDIYVVNK